MEVAMVARLMGLGLAGVALIALAQPVPPVARQVPKTFTVHGETLTDNYAWLRSSEPQKNPEIMNYLRAENTYTEAVSKAFKPLQNKLYTEFRARFADTDLSVPYRQGSYFYYTRFAEGQQYAIHARKRGSLKAREEILLDENRIAQGKEYLEITNLQVSDNEQLLAYMQDVKGDLDYTLYVKNLRTGRLLPDPLRSVSSYTWAADNRTLFFVQQDPQAQRPYRLYRYRLGSRPELLYEEKDGKYALVVYRTSDRRFIVLDSSSSTTSQIWTLPSDQPRTRLRSLVPREEGHLIFGVDHRRGLFYIQTNKKAQNFRIVTVPDTNPQEANWRDLVPGRPSIYLEGFLLFRDHMARIERVEGSQTLRITHLDSGASHTVALPDAGYSVAFERNPEFGSQTVRFTYTSLTTPQTVYDYHMPTRQLTLLKRRVVRGGFDAGRYQSERVFATAPDGARIPVLLVYRKDRFKRDGSNPFLLEGYGAYGINSDPQFAISRLSILDRGFGYALAQIRGGAELGRQWYEQGKLFNKKNTFNDFIAAAEHLIQENYTTSDRLVISGASAGGLLVGAVLNARPELFRAAIAKVPFVDITNTMLDETLPLTTGEFLEWGNPKIPEQFEYIRSYDPYFNVSQQDYPTLLVTGSLNDSQVSYWEPAKWVAKLRASKTDRNPLLFRVNLGAGHQGASGRFDFQRELAFELAFVLWSVGILE
ncbi:MAG: S9 family peptidase [Meiothermus sp.]|nr:S9 family peptidase [Meiothermus sp.]